MKFARTASARSSRSSSSARSCSRLPPRASAARSHTRSSRGASVRVSLASMRADLHRHLDGSLRRATLDELGASDGIDVPRDLTFTPGMGLEAALARFALTLSMLRTPERVRRIASEICEDAAADGVDVLEIRFAPQLHEAPIEAIVDAAIEGCAGRATVILCG